MTDKEKRKSYFKTWRDNNKEKIKEQRKKYYAENSEKVLEYQRKWRENHPENMKGYIKKQVERYQNDPEFRARQRASYKKWYEKQPKKEKVEKCAVDSKESETKPIENAENVPEEKGL